MSIFLIQPFMVSNIYLKDPRSVDLVALGLKSTSLFEIKRIESIGPGNN